MTKASVKPALKRIEEKIDQLVMAHEIQSGDDNTVAPNEEDSTPQVETIGCQCEKITVESEHDQESSEGES